ncbi:MAG TPA: NAD(P)-dependent oxidoreductase, partial [Burkholderiaceae bacterium]|nr:NAD(P)-dependent oxidoreductase [Burkholderiaceae bacterium]
MTRPRVFLTHGPSALAHYYGERALAALRAVADVQLHDSDAPWTLDALAAAAQHCDIVVSDRRAEGPAALLQRLPKLAAFVRCAVDIRNIDVPAASALGILVTQASAGFAASVSEWVFGATIDLSRGISDAVARYRAGASPVVGMGRELRGSTLGVIGYGQIGRSVAALGHAFGMRVVITDPHR